MGASESFATLSPLSMHVHCEAFPNVHRQSMSRDQGIPAISRAFHKTLRANRLGDMRHLPAIGLQGNSLTARKELKLNYNASFAKSKVPLANHLTLLNDSAITHLSRKSVILSRLLSQNFRESFKLTKMVAQV